MAKQKGTKTFNIDIGTLVVTVECDSETGFDGTKAELEEAVRQLVVEDIEQLDTHGNEWNISDVTVMGHTL